jgi:hypothetical protein
MPRRRPCRFTDLGLDPVGLWQYLLRWDYREAARGLLLDLLGETHHAVRAARSTDPDDQERTPDGERTASVIHHICRDWLMEVLGDADGRDTREWLELYARESGAVNALACTGELADRLVVHVTLARDALWEAEGKPG